MAFRDAEGETLSLSVTFLRYFSRIDALESRHPVTDCQIPEESLSLMPQPSLLTLGITHIDLSGYFHHDHYVLVFNLLRQVVNVSSVRSLVLPVGSNRKQDEFFDGFISTCENLRTIALNAAGRSGVKPASLDFQATERGTYTTELYKRKAHGPCVSDRIDFNLYRLPQLGLDRLILRKAFGFESRPQTSDHVSSTLTVWSSRWVYDLLSILPCSVQILEIHMNPLWMGHLKLLSPGIKLLRWNMLRDCLSHAITKPRIPGFKLSIHVDIEVFYYTSPDTSEDVTWKQVDEDIAECRKSAIASFKEYDTQCHCHLHILSLPELDLEV